MPASGSYLALRACLPKVVTGLATSPTDCYGESLGDDGIEAGSVDNCHGLSTATGNLNFHGIVALGSVQNSRGEASGGDGIQADIVSHSQGLTHSTSNSRVGIRGITSVHYSSAHSFYGDGISALQVSYSRGTTSAGSPFVGVRATSIAVACEGFVSSVYKYLMPP